MTQKRTVILSLSKDSRERPLHAPFDGLGVKGRPPMVAGVKPGEEDPSLSFKMTTFPARHCEVRSNRELCRATL